MKQQFNKNTPAIELVDFKSNIDSNQEFSRETMHLFCSPLFLEAMKVLFDKNIQTMSCGSGKERGILAGITGNFESLSEENKEIAKDMLISKKEFRIGVELKDDTTFGEFEEKILEIANSFNEQ
ncbi:MAG: hypothetical protein FWC11_07015 [Firmicutes bacterium]|nr:hypothetical protein [Bacillota bacterium]